MANIYSVTETLVFPLFIDQEYKFWFKARTNHLQKVIKLSIFIWGAAAEPQETSLCPRGKAERQHKKQGEKNAIELSA